MRKKPRTPKLVRTGAAIVAVGVGLMALYSCSLLVETQSQQCQSDQDCSAFQGAKCDTATGACVPASTTSSSGTAGTTSSSTGGPAGCDVDGGIDGGGCFSTTRASCTADNDAEILNACTTGCIPFDDSTVKGLLPNGTLPSLPTPPDGGL